ncbi:PREDICTED: uncharacterized protein LOC109242879 [Nicotiana attenuata]|uniref:uncharacterized protein LOC109242879 n=1 Tax=Nicotiana attenuata TaxID=49451 RepID=UPI0009052552|nr:PREDICTED: uncharacterized protein LOC109242879 [Nicotiana attenuata]
MLETARAVKFQGHLPTKLWRECIESAVYIINKIPSTVLGNKSPFELLYKRQPYFSHMRVIGCLCFASTLPKCDKFQPRAVKDVIFYEDAFPFHNLEITTESLSFNTDSPTRAGDTFLPCSAPSDVPATVVNTPPLHCPISFPESIFLTDTINSSSDTTSMPTTEKVLPVNESTVPIAPQDIVKKSTQVSKPPIWLSDYVRPDKQGQSNTCMYPLSDVIGYDHISTKYHNYLSQFSNEVKPTTFHEVAKDKHWVEAMQAKIKALEDNNT